jgi:hypothetical protein
MSEQDFGIVVMRYRESAPGDRETRATIVERCENLVIPCHVDFLSTGRHKERPHKQAL